MTQTRDHEILTSAECGTGVFAAISKPHGIAAALGRSPMAAVDAEDACAIAAGADAKGTSPAWPCSYEQSRRGARGKGHVESLALSR
jgi:hypothetical protein